MEKRAAQTAPKQFFDITEEPYVFCCRLKGTVSRDFLPQVFFINHLPPSPWKEQYGHFKFFKNICKSRCTNGINNTGGKFASSICQQYQLQRPQILPPVPLVLLIPLANWPPVSTAASLYRQCQQLQWQIMGKISDCWHLKVNLKEILYLFVNSTTERCPNKIIKTFVIEDFLHLPPVSMNCEL